MFITNDLKLEGIGVENYKIFQNYQYFNLAPLTILTGPNNSGKSALASSLLLLAKNEIFSHLEFHKEGLDIGDLSQIIHNQADARELKFDLKFGIRCKSMNHPYPSALINAFDCFKILLTYTEEGKIAVLTCLQLIIDNEIRIEVKEDTYHGPGTGWNCYIDYGFFEGKYLMRLFGEKLKQSQRNENSSPEVGESLAEKSDSEKFKRLTDILSSIPDTESFVQDFVGGIINPDLLEKLPELSSLEEKIRVELNEPFIKKNKRIKSNRNISSKDPILDIIKEYFTLSNITGTDEDAFHSKEDLKSRFKDVINDFLKNYDDDLTFVDIIENLFSKSFISFFGLLKSEIFELFNAVKEELNFTRHVETQRATKQRLFLYQEKNNPLSRDIIDIAESNLKEVNDFLRQWTGYGDNGFQLFDDYKITGIEGVGYKFQVLKNDKWVELSDLGYGTRQIIPVIFAIFNHLTRQKRPNGYGFFDMLIIEEPESNLHPKLQSLLADLFVYAKNHGALKTLLLIETHSEYLIRKIQYLIAKNVISNDKVAIHYIGENINNDSREIFEIRIDPDGSIDRDFGKGFFDEATNWKFELLKLKNAQKN